MHFTGSLESPFSNLASIWAEIPIARPNSALDIPSFCRSCFKGDRGTTMLHLHRGFPFLDLGLEFGSLWEPLICCSMGFKDAVTPICSC
jgi:hypothetical protein